MKKALSLFVIFLALGARAPGDNLTITTSSTLYNATVGLPYLYLPLQAVGGLSPYNWVADDVLPDGLSLDPSGVLAYCNPGNVVIAPNGSMDGPAMLPQSCFFTDSSATPSPGNVITVNEGDSLQSALNAAACGDVIQLEAGASFDGNHVTFPAKNCDDANWITVRTSTPDELLPSEGTRMTPCWAGVDSLPGRPAYACPPGGVPPTSLLVKIVFTSKIGRAHV